MITPAYGVTATERVLPKTTIDFTTAVLSPLITFSRSGNTATRINSSGLVETVSANTPRFDYNPSTLACNGLLIEETRENLFTYSADLTNASWDFTGTARTANAGTAPDGTNTATRVQFSANSFLYKNAIPAAGTSFTISVWVKSYNGSNQTIRLFGNGVLTLSSDITATSTWQRVTFTFTFTATTSGFTTASGQTADVLMWGAQLEAGAFGTSYIPTVASTVTRNADVATITGTNFTSWWQAVTGSAVVKSIPSTVSGVRPVMQFDDNTAINFISLRGNSADPELYIKATIDQAQIDAGSISANSAYSIAGAWSTNNCGAAVNGGAAVTDASVTVPTVSQARLGSDGTNYLNGWLQSFRYWPQRLTDSEIQAFSKS